MKEIVRVALAQIDIRPSDPKANFEKIEQTVANIVAEGPVELVVFPALTNTGYPRDGMGPHMQRFLADAEPLGGPFVSELRSLAKRYGIHLVAGVLEEDAKSSQTAFNSGLLIDPSGELLGCQRQLHLVGQDRDFFSHGEAINLFPSSLGNIGLIVDTDLQYPEVARVQTLAGAEILCGLINWEKAVSNPAEWLALIAILRAMENAIYFLVCNRVGLQGENFFFGASCIAHRDNEILAQSTSEAEDVVRAELSADLFIEERFAIPSLRDRRPENYGMICQKWVAPL